jgi:DNA polymerase-3 subunit chi
MPQVFEKFTRLIEVVSQDEADRSLARQRWKQYTERGYALIKHDLQLKGAN